jgi:hypothetical protein
MAYSNEEKESILNSIFEIIENGKSLRSALIQVKISSSTFFIWIDSDLEKSKQYARAAELRAETLLDEMFCIVDETSGDIDTVEIGEGITIEKVNHENIQRSRLRYDARKWLVSKLNPKKYGDKIDVTTDGDKLPNAIPIVLSNGRSYDDLLNDLKPE